jgi:enamine deaminase RidA (YjgF/YER057c/UK114 family)
MERRKINPWQWQDSFGFSQAVEVRQPERILLCAGQTSVDANGTPQHAGDMAAQMTLAMDNVEAVLNEAGMSLANVTRLNIYTTDVDAVLGAYGGVAQRLGAAGCQPASTLLGVARLAFPELMVEIEVTAAA